jgi:hypothetical protein
MTRLLGRSLLWARPGTLGAAFLLSILILHFRVAPARAYWVIGYWGNAVQNYGFDAFGNLNGIDASTAEAQISAAAQTWTNQHSALARTQSGSGYSIHIRTCVFGDPLGCEPRQPNNGPAVTDSPVYTNGLITSETVSFNSGGGVAWTTACPAPAGQSDVQTVALHELGHTIALGDLYNGVYFNPPDSIMGYNIAPNNCLRTPGQDDLDGLFAMVGYRYYVSGVNSYNNGWNSELWVQAIQTANVTTRFYGGMTYSSASSYSDAFSINQGTIGGVAAGQYINGVGGQSGVYGATIDSNAPISIVHPTFNKVNTTADATGQVGPYQQQLVLEAAQSAPSIPSYGTGGPPCPLAAANTNTYVPLIMDNNSGWTTQMVIQDVGPWTCPIPQPPNNFNVTVSYFDPTGTRRAIIQNTFNGQNSLGEDRTWVLSQAGDGVKVGSALIQSPDNVIVTVEQSNSASTSTIYYKSFSTAGASSISYLPLLQNNNHGWYSGIQIQNMSTTTGTTAIVFANGVSMTTSWIAPLAAYTIYPLPSQFTFTVGSGYVQSNNGGVNIATIVNQVDPGSNEASTYDGFSSWATELDFPLVMNNGFDSFTGTDWTTWTSGVTVENVGTYGCIQLNYPGGSSSVNLAQYQAYSWYPPPGLGSGASTSMTATSCSGSGAQIVGTINQIGPAGSGNDAFYTTDAGLR